MRVLYLHRTQGEEPESIHIDAIIQALRNLGHEVILIGPPRVKISASGRVGFSVSGTIKRTVPGFVFELIQLGYNVIAYLRLRAAARKFRPDLIYERYALHGVAGTLFARNNKIPLILEVNTPYAMAWAKYFGLFFKRLARWIELKTFTSAPHIITVTHAQKAMLEQAGVAATKITVCHNAIEPEQFVPGQQTADALRSGLGLSGIVVGFVGTMNRWQGMQSFGKVIADVTSQAENVRFLLVGDGEFRQELESYCQSAGCADKVVFTGRKPHSEVPGLVAAMDIAILLNSNDYGSPMKIFEYLAMGKAVVAPRVAPVEEILTDGETGLLIAAGDADAMTQKIVLLAGDADLRHRLGSAGRAYVVANHTWRENALRVLAAASQIGLSAGAMDSRDKRGAL